MKLRRNAQALLTAGALLLTASACVGGDGGGADGSFRASVVSGAVLVRLPGADDRVLRTGDNVPTGSVVKTASDGFLQLQGGEGQLVELLGDTQVALVDAQRATLEIGRALGQSGEKDSFVVQSRGTAVRVAESGATRIERLLGSLRVGVYRGSARVELVGRGVDVPGLREVVIAGGVPLERAPRPLTLSPTDRWDRRLLGDVLDFDGELVQFGTGFDSLVGRASAPQFFADFVPLTNLAFLRSQVPTAEPSEVLVGLIFAQQLAARDGIPNVAGLYRELQGLRDLGASWGLIAKEKGLELRLVLQGVLDAIRRGTAPPAPATGGGGGTGTGGNDGDNGGGSTPEPKASPSPSPTPTDDPDPPEEPPPGEECSLLERLLGNCPEAAASGTGSASTAEECELVAVLLDPNC